MDLPNGGTLKVVMTHAVLEDCIHTVKHIYYIILHVSVRGLLSEFWHQLFN